ncbi:hypothetical protein LCGC14_2514870, partial [marine sediment metagenome]
RDKQTSQSKSKESWRMMGSWVIAFLMLILEVIYLTDNWEDASSLRLLTISLIVMLFITMSLVIFINNERRNMKGERK